MKSVVSSSSAAPARLNRLAREKSPYLLQHQSNPVDWQPWGEPAFDQARREHKPVFLSVGYSTCHWCHVMERESFENQAVAAFLNEHFVSIKVDREERPDIDKIYMTFVQATTGQGGWPMSVFLTPELKPFYGGTYFPPDSNYGRPGFLQLLQHIAQLWQNRRDDLMESAAEIQAKLEQIAETQARERGGELTSEALQKAGELFKSSYDPRHGGFGGAPKFPQPSQPQFLLRYAHRFGDAEAIRMVLHTCERMAAGGIHDQLGGGFARYSVDAEWLVPHFEKMLYDNAQLAQLYLDAYLVSGNPKFAQVARDVLEYVLRDMTHPEGGFYSAEDADSEGHEGRFYCWTRQELKASLPPAEFQAAVKYFGITERGNFVDHSHPQPLAGQNVLSVCEPNLSKSETQAVASAKARMFAARAKRVRPHLDDKVLASWNGLMLGAFARASAVLDNATYRMAAEKNFAFVQARLWDPKNRKLSHRWRDGERDEVELLEGYAFLLAGVLDLYEASLEPKHLKFAVELAETMLAKFYDPEQGGFWQGLATAKDLILRVKEAYDGAEPSGNSVAIFALLRLSRITGQPEFKAAGEKSLLFFARRLQQLPQAVPYLLQALDFYLDEPRRAVVAGDPTDTQIGPLLHAIHSGYLPNKVVMGNQGAVEPFARTLPAKTGPMVYWCSGTACEEPTNDLGRIQATFAKPLPVAQM